MGSLSGVGSSASGLGLSGAVCRETGQSKATRLR